MKAQADNRVGRVLGELNHAPNLLDPSVRDAGSKRERLGLRDYIRTKPEKLKFKRRYSSRNSKETSYSGQPTSKDKSKENKGKRKRQLAMKIRSIKQRLLEDEELWDSTSKKPQRYASPTKLPRKDRAYWFLLQRLKPDFKQSVEPNKPIYFMVKDTYAFSNKLKFSTLLRKIYFENYKTKDIRNFLYYSLCKPFTTKMFFETIEREANTFGESVRKEIIKLIDKVRIDIDVKLFGEHDESSTDSFLSYSEAKGMYKKVFKLIFEYYELLETVHEEIKNLIIFYLKAFSLKQYTLTTSDFYFHKAILVKTVHHDKNIKYFLNLHYSWIYHNSFYKKAYPEILNGLEKLMQNFGYTIFSEDEENEDEYYALEIDDDIAVHKLSNKEVEDIKNNENDKKAKRKKKKKNKKKKKQAEAEEEKNNKYNKQMLQIFNSKLSQRDRDLFIEKVCTRKVVKLTEQEKSVFKEIIQANRC